MSTSYSNFFNGSNSFGINVKRPETAPKQHVEKHETENNNFFKPVEKIANNIKDVFNGNVANELNKYRSWSFTTELILHDADVKVNGQKPTFDMTV